MFLLFQFLRYHHGFCFQDLHSNMFLLFLSSARRKRSLRQFTFQYVSIISLLSPRHSFLPEAHLHSNMFLLFRDFLFLLLSLPTYLHSNMFLLFPFCSLPVSVLLRHLHSNMFLLFLYIAERLILCVQNLHSNMFLLFRDTHFKDYLSTKEFTFQYVSIISDKTFMFDKFATIYIPICFYYFRIDSPTSISNVSIYIPICFYYFGKCVELQV